MAFDAGSIIARLDLEDSEFDRKLAADVAKIEAFERRTHQVPISPEMDPSGLRRARTQFERFDQQVTQDAVRRARSGRGSLLGALTGLFGGGHGGLLRGLSSWAGGGGSSGAAGGLLRGIGPSILGLGAKPLTIGSLIPAALGALPAVGGIGGVLGIGALGLGAIGAGRSAIGQSNVFSLASQLNQAQAQQAAAVTPAQKAAAAAQIQGIRQSVAQMSPALQALYHSTVMIQNAWQNIGKAIAPAFVRPMQVVAHLFTSLAPLIERTFRAGFALATPFIRGLGDLARMVLPLLAQAFRIIAPLMRPVIDGLGRFVAGLLRGLMPLLRAAAPAIRVFAQILAMLGNDLGKVFAAFAPAIRQSSVIFRALMGVLGALLPIVGRLAAVFAQALAPVFKDIASVIRSLLPFLDIIGKVVAALAVAVLKDLVAAFGALAKLLIDLSPSFKVVADALSRVFNVLETSGVFAILGDALEKLVPILAQFVNTLIRQLAPELPVLITLVSQFSSIIITLFAAGLATVLRGLTLLITKLPFLAPLLATAAAAWWLVNIAMSANPIGVIILAIGLLVGAVTLMVTHWSRVWGVIKRVAADAWNFIYNGFGKYLLPLLGPVGLIALGAIELAQHWHTIWHGVTTAISDFETFVQAWVLRINILFAGWARNILHYAQDAFGWLPSWLPGVSGIKAGLAAASSDLARFVASTQAQLAALTHKTYSLTFGLNLPAGVSYPQRHIKGRAGGGGVGAGEWAMVGEQGPELAYFAGGGHVIPNGALKGYAAGSGAVTVHLSLPSLQAMGSMLHGVVGAIVSQVQRNFILALGLPGAPVGAGGGVAKYAPAALAVLRMLGQPAADLGTVMSQMSTESGGNPYAVNRTDINWLLGHPSVGLMQIIAGTFARYAGPFRGTGPFLYGVSVNPLANIFAGLNYAIHTYPNWTSVLGHGHGYDRGGWLMPGLSWNATGQREAVLEPTESQAFIALAHAAAGRGALAGGQDMDRLLAKLDRLIKAAETAPNRTGSALNEALTRGSRRAAYSSGYGV